MSKVSITVIPHDQQRYNTVGDYQTINGDTEIRVSEMGNPSEELAIGLHELVESHLCKLAGISDEQIDMFDLWYEENCEEGWPAEPGDHPDCPYYKQHQFASIVERMFIRESGVNWNEYDNRITAMMNRD